MDQNLTPTKKDSLFSRFRSFCIGHYQSMRAFYSERPHAYLLFCFLLPFLIMGIVYALFQVFPFGENSILVLDMNGQYVYFFEGFRDWVYGDASLLYSFSRSMGGEFMGMFAYYLASPLSFIVALFPKQSITEALFLMFLLKCGLSGLTMGVYLERVPKTNKHTTVMFSMMYALCGYAIVMQNNTMWTDNLILLPLVALGVEEMIRHRKFKVYTFSLAVAIMSNYYIGYMMCIFVVLYCAYAYFGKTADERNPLGERFHFLRCLGQIILFSGIALAIASVIWIPAYYSLTFGKTTFSNPTYEFVTKFDLFDLITKCFFGTYDTVRPEGLPILYCGTLAIFTLPFYFLRKDIRIRQKAATAVLMGLLIFSFNIKPIDMLWHGLQNPNWLNHRYAFMLVFIILVAAAKGFEDIKSHTPRALLLIGATAMTLLLIAEAFGSEWISFLLVVLPSLLFFLLIGGVLVLMIRKKALPCRGASLAMILLVSLELLLGAVAHLYMLDKDVIMSNRTGYRTYIDRWQPAVNYVQIHDDGFYRMEKTKIRKVNDPFGLGYNGLSGSTSTLNADTLRYMHNLGINARSHLSEYHRPVPVVDSFFSIKYILSEKDTPMTSLYNKIYTTNSGVDIYENPYALPIAYAVNSNIANFRFEDPPEPKEGEPVIEDDRTTFSSKNICLRYNQLLSILLDTDIEVMVPIPYEMSAYNARQEAAANHHRFWSNENGAASFVRFEFSGVEGKEIYMSIPAIYTRDVRLYLGQNYLEHIGNILIGEDGPIDIGAFKSGETQILWMQIYDKNNKNVYFEKPDPYFYYLDDEVFRAAFTELQKGGFQVTEHTQDHLLGTITVPEDRTTVMTSIPYDKGWQILCDGEKVEFYELLDGVIAFDLAPGVHSLEMEYFPKEYTLAILVSLGGMLLLVGILLGEFLWKWKKTGVMPFSKRPTCPVLPTVEEPSTENDSTENAPPQESSEDDSSKPTHENS